MFDLQLGVITPIDGGCCVSNSMRLRLESTLNLDDCSVQFVLRRRTQLDMEMETRGRRSQTSR